MTIAAALLRLCIRLRFSKLPSAFVLLAFSMPLVAVPVSAEEAALPTSTSVVSPAATVVYQAGAAPKATIAPVQRAPMLVTLSSAIQRYREKNFVEADRMLSQLHEESPQNTKTTYYLAITKAQEGEYVESAKLYQEVMSAEPSTPLGLLSQEGLRNLPLTTTANVDAPPQFQSAGATAFTTPSNAGATPGMQGVSQSDWMWMQQMMGNNNNNSNNNNNDPWGSLGGMGGGNNNMGGMNFMPPMMPGMNNGKPIDPQVMSSWLTNQMLQNSTQFMNQNDDK